MKKKLVIATLGLMLVFSSVISVAGVRAFVRDQSRADYQRALAWQHAHAAFLRAQAAAEAPQAPQPSEPPAPRRGRGAPPPEDIAPIPIDAPRFEEYPTDEDFERYRRSRNAIRLGQNLAVGADETVRDAVVIFGDAVVAGRVTGKLAVVFGTARIASTAVIDGDFVSVGGAVVVQPGAIARRDVVVIGGPLDAPAGFVAGGEQIVVGSGMLGGWLNEAAPYLSRGPLWGRMIVPDLPWIWGVVAIFFLLYAALNLIFDRPVRACALTLRTRPFTTFGAGLLALLLIGPICVLLAVSIIGIAVVPFVICAVVAGGLVGKVAVARWIGMSAVEEDADGSRAHGARSFVIGFAVLTIAYMVPVIGLISWGIAGVLGLGSAALTFLSAYRRENPSKPPVVVPPAAPPPPSYPPMREAPSVAFDASAAATPTAPPPFQASTPPPAPAYATAYAPAAAYAASGLLVAQPRALFRDRLAAFVIDVLVLFVSVFFLDAINVADAEAFFPLLLIYMIVAWTWKQTTFGGVVCQIRLVRTDGGPLSFADALVRALAGIFSLALLAIGALWILRDPERQAWHDKIAGTYVVKVPRSWPV
jgi:uncharacterized RDD family membrane protein YckC